MRHTARPSSARRRTVPKERRCQRTRAFFCSFGKKEKDLGERRIFCFPSHSISLCFIRVHSTRTTQARADPRAGTVCCGVLVERFARGRRAVGQDAAVGRDHEGALQRPEQGQAGHDLFRPARPVRAPTATARRRERGTRVSSGVSFPNNGKDACLLATNSSSIREGLSSFHTYVFRFGNDGSVVRKSEGPRSLERPARTLSEFKKDV